MCVSCCCCRVKYSFLVFVEKKEKDSIRFSIVFEGVKKVCFVYLWLIIFIKCGNIVMRWEFEEILDKVFFF